MQNAQKDQNKQDDIFEAEGILYRWEHFDGQHVHEGTWVRQGGGRTGVVTEIQDDTSYPIVVEDISGSTFTREGHYVVGNAGTPMCLSHMGVLMDLDLREGDTFERWDGTTGTIVEDRKDGSVVCGSYWTYRPSGRLIGFTRTYERSIKRIIARKAAPVRELSAETAQELAEIVDNAIRGDTLTTALVDERTLEPVSPATPSAAPGSDTMLLGGIEAWPVEAITRDGRHVMLVANSMDHTPVYLDMPVVGIVAGLIGWCTWQASGEHRHEGESPLDIVGLWADRELATFEHWDLLDSKVKSVAQDSTGEWYAYRGTPTVAHARGVWDAPGEHMLLTGTLRKDLLPTAEHWETSLIGRPVGVV